MYLPTYVETILDLLEEAGYEAYVVGGCVRDWLLNKDKKPKDYDICTNALPNDVKHIFYRFNVVDTGIKHGTVTIVIDEHNVEVTTYRIDGIYSDNRRPDEVQFTSSLQEDLARRDFTINAMAYSPKTGLIDPFGGKEDCENKIIKCVGKPTDRFNEDALRMLRAIRFACVLGFFVEETTQKALKENFYRVADVSIERQVAEFTKILLSENLTSLNTIYRNEMKTLPFIGSYRYLDNWRLFQINELPKDLAMRLAAFFRMKKPTKEKIEMRLREMRLPNNLIEEVLQIRQAVERKLFYKFRNGFLSPAYIYETLHMVGKEILLKALCLEGIVEGYHGIFICNYYNNLVAFIEELTRTCPCINISDLKYNGNDALNSGYEGKQIGEILNYLLRCVWENQALNDFSVLNNIVRKKFPLSP